MGTNNSKIEQDDELNFQVETTDTKLYQQQQNNSSEQKNLLYKFHNRSFYGTPSAQSSSERIEQSDSSLSSLPYKTKKLLFKKNKKKKSTNSSSESEQNTSFLSSQSTLIVDDPMTAAVERLNARFMSETHISNFDSCSDAQRRLECIESDKSTINSTRLSLEKTHSCNSSRSHKQDTCYEKWLSTTLETPKQKLLQEHERQQREKQNLTSRDAMFDTFFRNTNESERRKEKDRQQRMHYLLKRIWNGIYRVELVDPKTIVNWCCGIGVWDMEMALLFPNAKVIAIDFEGATSSNLQHGIPNLEFRHTAIQNHVTGLESIESDTVDFVMMRDVWLINAPEEKWFNVLNESYRILKPGGWIEIAQHLLQIESQGPKLEALDRYFQNFFTKAQIDRNVCLKLSKYLDDTGFVQVDELSVVVPVGEWCATTTLKEIGFLTRDLLDRRLRSLSKLVAEANDIEESELSKLITGCSEETDLFNSRMNWASFTGKKPLI